MTTITDEALQASAWMGSQTTGVLVEAYFKNGSSRYLVVPHGESMNRWAREYGLRIEGSPTVRGRRTG